ncbi:hypothetical protein EUTSA_v10025415mg [Eutrema salsugineum]|uniref:F-box domain-containing protein n=2 Tax=Eutrema salsugineum TaxID=72664 RepID=V4MB53_EUTSA|nr:hypothetical protein EUTSA_v10025415mg [Eutrema salsugineum]
MTNPPPLSMSFSSVPNEIIANCLARISKSHYRSLSSVSKSFYSLLSSPEIYAARFQIGATEPRLYICLRLPRDTHHRWFNLMNPDQALISNGGEIKSELSLVPVKQKLSSSYAYAPSNATIVAVGSEIYQIGKSKEDKRSRSVRVLDCRSHTLRRAPKMTVARKGAKSCFLDGKIYVIGGCRKREEPMSWGEVFDIKTQTWKLLPSPSGHGFHPKHKVVVFGARLYVVTKQNKYVYDPKERRWLLEMGLVGLERLVSGNRPWCVIENVLFSHYCGKLWWYELSRGEWLMVEGLGDLYTKRADVYRTIQLVNHGGKLVIIWHEWIDMVRRKNNGFERYLGIKGKRTCCAVIRLEKRLSSSGSEEILGEIERLNVVVPTLPRSYDVLTCLSVSL